MQEYVLLKFQADYADEFDVYGLLTWTKEQWEEYKKELEELEYPQEHYFGTNESIEFVDADDYLSNITVTNITEEQYKTLIDLGLRHYGTFLMLGE
jgi:hypothetical protein